MLATFLALALLGQAVPAAVGVLPDPELTPGSTDPAVTPATILQTICVKGYTSWKPPEHPKRIRNVSEATKRKVVHAYRAKHPDWPLCPPFGCEVDHLVSLELGGSNDAANLWPEAYEIDGAPGQGARDKDKIENALHRAVCSGKIGLREAQDRIVKDWRTALEGIR